ncbi:rho guanine nucleotide exchange factor 3-like [Tachypleus tridentatus]|uniref:rho guanine nucleotide exchange factor 3-like n=1 Tax=Tachypleus tridentatus TaxID=6853 RepID=UPI003FCF7727
MVLGEHFNKNLMEHNPELSDQERLEKSCSALSVKDGSSIDGALNQDVFTDPSETMHTSDTHYEGNTSLFLEPPPKSKHFQFISKKRKRESDEDSLSTASFDISLLNEEPWSKRKKRISSFPSFTSLLSPAKPVKRMGEVFHRSLSNLSVSSKPSSSIPVTVSQTILSGDNSCRKLRRTSSGASSPSTTPYKQPKATPKKCRTSQLWLDTLSEERVQVVKENMSHKELKRQEAIFELYRGEEDIVDDLNLVLQIYRHSLIQLEILTSEELRQIFGSMDNLLCLHQDLLDELKEQRKEDNAINSVGQVIKKWVPGLKAYVPYCSNQFNAKALLEEKKTHDLRFEDFLQRCLESPFSRRLDLWSFLDVPRNRLVKYPLLLKAILKQTPHGHEDKDCLPEVIKKVDSIIQLVDIKTGKANCEFILNKLDFLEKSQKDPLIHQAKSLLCSGILRNSRGTKLHAFLFDTGIVLTRPATRWSSSSNLTSETKNSTRYQVYRKPIPAHQLLVENVKDGEVRIGGSFRSAFSYTSGAKYVFKLTFMDKNLSQSHTLQANDEHDKKQWLQNLYKVRSNHWCSSAGLSVTEERKEGTTNSVEDCNLDVTQASILV